MKVTDRQIVVMGSVIGVSLMSPILYLVCKNSHWSVAFMLIGNWFSDALKQFVKMWKRK